MDAIKRREGHLLQGLRGFGIDPRYGLRRAIDGGPAMTPTYIPRARSASSSRVSSLASHCDSRGYILCCRNEMQARRRDEMKRWLVLGMLFSVWAGPVINSAAQAVAGINSETAQSLQQVTFTPLDGVATCDWSPDGSQLAAGTASGVFTVNQDFPGSPPVALSEQLAPALDLAYTPDGSGLVVANPAQVQVWNLARGFRSLRVDGAGPVAVSPDSTMLALTDGGQTIQLVSLTDGRPAATMTGHEGPITDVGFAPTGQYLASSSLDNTLRLWDVATGEQMRFQRSRRRPQLALDVNPYASTVASGTLDGIVRLLNVTITTEGQYNLRPRADVVDVAYSPDGLLLALAAGSNLFVWTMDPSQLPVVIPLAAPASCVAWSPDGTQLLVGTASGLAIFAPA